MPFIPDKISCGLLILNYVHCFIKIVNILAFPILFVLFIINTTY